MAIGKRNPWFSFESDNDEIDLEQDVTGTVTELDETAVDEAGEDSETTDVTPDANETSHNEVASAGGVATGNNLDQLEMDPVAASESYIRRVFGLSREDMEEATDQIEAKAEAISEEPVGSGDSEVDSYVSDADDDPGTTVNITSPSETHIDINAAGDEVEVGTDAELESGAEEDMTASDVVALESLRRLCSMEDDDMSGGDENPDVELDVKTSSQDTNFKLEDKAVTIEPNEDGDDMGGDEGGDYGTDEGDDMGGDEGSGDEEGGDYGADEGNEEGNEGGEEEGGNEETNEGFYFW